MKSKVLGLVLVSLLFSAQSFAGDEISCDLSVAAVIQNDDNDPEFEKYPQVWGGGQWFTHYKNGRENVENRLTVEEVKKTVVKDYERLLDGKLVRSGIPMLSADGDQAYAADQGSVKGLKSGNYAIIKTKPVSSSVFIYVNVYKGNELALSANGIMGKDDNQIFLTADSDELAKLRVETNLEEIEIFQKLKLGSYASLNMSCNKY